ncbi:F-box protein At5g07610-like [Diospyros lotus]|uniref:F-box protein At5g07610-like n=1 Tax=Diospyros lotus TaxID=55363 RepID=UPI00225A9CB0|nr:F-box protein At5g07610-like [Diospyros lotus]
MASEAGTPTIKRRGSANECPKRMAPSSDVAIDGNDDLITEILRRLPAKSLLRFRSVSKRWFSLISHPDFTVLWTKSNCNSTSGLFLRSLSHSSTPTFHYIPLNSPNPNQPNFTSLDFVPDQPQGIDIIQSCNGLLLCSAFRLRHHSCSYYVYNPTTHKFIALPNPRPFGFENRIVRGVSLAFDPSESAHYKVVCIFSHSSLLRGTYWVQIYSSETRSWELYDDLVLGPFDMVFDSGVFWNHAIHWLSRESDTSFCFDVDGECPQTTPMPPLKEGEKERNFGYFGESRGHLHLVLSCGSQTALVDVFEMATDYSKWCLIYRVDFDAVLTSFLEKQLDFSVPLDYCKFSVLTVLSGVSEDDLVLVVYIPGKAISYNLKDKYLEKLSDLRMHSNDEYISSNCRWVVAHQYVESLFSV